MAALQLLHPSGRSRDGWERAGQDYIGGQGIRQEFAEDGYNWALPGLVSAQELKAVGSRAAAVPLALTMLWGNDQPHGGKGINRLGLREDSHY